jgi:Zn-dependent protease with chaperone function
LNIEGRYFDGRSSVAVSVRAQLLDDGELMLSAPGFARAAPLAEIEVSDRIGNMARRLEFSDGASCELLDNDAIDRWLTGAGVPPRLRLVHWLEQRWPYAIVSLLALMALSWAFIQYGVPVLARVALRQVPVSLDQNLGKGTLAALDRIYVKPTTLSAERQQQLRAIFASVVTDQPDPAHFRLELRRGGRIGPNALALPDGVIVLTDELAVLSENPDELRAVFAHEVGHVLRRHGMLTVLQSSAVGALTFALFADVASISNLMAGAPALLATAKYSRALETEADDVAFVYLRRHGIPARVMSDLLTRVEKKLGSKAPDLGYFSTHPPARERIR